MISSGWKRVYSTSSIGFYSFRTAPAAYSISVTKAKRTAGRQVSESRDRARRESDACIC